MRVTRENRAVPIAHAIGLPDLRKRNAVRRTAASRYAQSPSLTRLGFLMPAENLRYFAAWSLANR